MEKQRNPLRGCCFFFASVKESAPVKAKALGSPGFPAKE